MADNEALRKMEDCRTAVLFYLYKIRGCSQEAEMIHRFLGRGHDFSLDDVKQTLSYLTGPIDGKQLVEAHHHPLGGTKSYQITTEGCRFVEQVL